MIGHDAAVDRQENLGPTDLAHDGVLDADAREPKLARRCVVDRFRVVDRSRRLHELRSTDIEVHEVSCLGAVELVLGDNDLAAIEAAVPAEAAAGTRYDAMQMSMLDSEK